MKRRRIEEGPVDRVSISRLTAPRRQQTADNGIASRVRRDSKNALEQRPSATACGEHPMIAVPILGRAVRLYKSWYALCAYCGAVTRVQLHVHRYGSEICCLRCDHGKVTAAAPSTSAATRQCRYCGVRCEGNTSGWKEIKAPLDIAGANAVLPPPLRRVWYCRQHFRGWVAGAHRVMQTRVILAHLAHNAKPLYGNDCNDALGADELLPAASKGAKHRPKPRPKPKAVRKRK